MRGNGRFFGCLAAALLLAASPAAADWLVLTNGERLETAGPWEEKGKLLVFRLADGSLASMRLADVDLAASAAATAEAARAAERPAPAAAAPEPPPGRPAWVITDADVGHVNPGSAAAPSAAEEPESAARLVVTAWEEQPSTDLDGIRIAGRLANQSLDVVANAALRVRLVDAAGEPLGETGAELTARTLPPSTSVNFVARFPGVFVYSRVEFEPAGLAVAASGDEGPRVGPPGGGP